MTIRGWHGRVSNSLAKKVDSFATPVSEAYEWKFDGTLNEFAEKFRGKFVVFPQATNPEEEWPCDFFIGITDHGGFGTR